MAFIMTEPIIQIKSLISLFKKRYQSHPLPLHTATYRTNVFIINEASNSFKFIFHLCWRHFLTVFWHFPGIFQSPFSLPPLPTPHSKNHSLKKSISCSVSFKLHFTDQVISDKGKTLHILSVVFYNALHQRRNFCIVEIIWTEVDLMHYVQLWRFLDCYLTIKNKLHRWHHWFSFSLFHNALLNMLFQAPPQKSRPHQRGG